jgi:hypothetical protein
MVRNIAGKDVICAIGGFDSHYMPIGMTAGDAFRSRFDIFIAFICIIVIKHLMAIT